MNKVFIRTRQIDNNKQLPILLRENDDLTDLNEYSNISKSSQILSGMDKGEESEHHLQEVLRELQYDKTVFNKAIPIPEVIEEPSYDYLYKTDFKLPKHYIRLKTLDFEDELPEYDIDEEDKEWLENSKLNVSPLKFEQIIEQFEKACCQKALLLDEAKSLLRHEAIHLVIAIYDYWLTKRVNTGQALILSVKAEKAERCNNTPIDPYIAFRKRSEKMTTRKNRRVDEASYEKMYRLRYQMEKLNEIIQLVSKREETKSQITQNERDVFVKRYEARDYDKLQLKESEITVKRQAIKLGDNFKSAQRSREENQKETKRKRSYSKCFENNQSSLEHQSEDIDFTFKPMSKCKYLPSRFTIVDNNNNYTTDNISNNISNNNNNNNNPSLYQHYPFNQSPDNDDPKSFSINKLSYLPESLQKLNVPVRFRMNSNKMLSIDLELSNAYQAHNQRLTPQSFHPHPHSKSENSIMNINNSFVNPISNMLDKSSKNNNPLIQKLISLYNRNVFCGLPLMNFPTHGDSDITSANHKHISSLAPSPLPPAVPSSSSHRTSDSFTIKDSTPVKLSAIKVPTSSSSPLITSGNHLNYHNYHYHSNNFGPVKSLERVVGINRYSTSSEKVDSSIMNHRLESSSRPNKFSSSNLINHNHISSMIPENDKILSSSSSTSSSIVASINNNNNTNFKSSLSISKSLLSNNQNGINICTYQNNSYLNSDNGNKNCAFINESSDNHNRQPSVNGQHRKTTATKELVESPQTNHSLNGVFKNKLSNCLKTLTNKRVIPRKDINEISFYSKSNGHHQHSWLKQNTTDNCLTPNLVMPLWKSEPHVMTSVNKMT